MGGVVGTVVFRVGVFGARIVGVVVFGVRVVQLLVVQVGDCGEGAGRV